MSKDSKDKNLYKFSIFMEKEVEKTVEAKDEGGADIKITKRVKESTPIEFIIKKPTRKIKDEADEAYAIKLSDCIRKGMLTVTMLNNQYLKVGGVVTEDIKERYDANQRRMERIQLDIANISLVEKKTEEDTASLQDLFEELKASVAFKIGFDSNYNKYFENTAENYAKEEKLKFLLTHMLQVKNGNHFEDYFTGKTFKEKKDSLFDKDDEDDELYRKVFPRVAPLIMYWELGHISTDEEFKEFDAKMVDHENSAAEAK